MQGHWGSPGRDTNVWSDRPISRPWLVRITLLGRPGLVQALLQGLMCEVCKEAAAGYLEVMRYDPTMDHGEGVGFREQGRKCQHLITPRIWGRGGIGSLTSSRIGVGKSEELVWGCWHGSVPGCPGELWTAGGWGWSLADDADCRGAGVCRPTHGPGGRAAGVEGGVSVKPQGCLAFRGEQTDWGVGELKSLGLRLLRGSGLAHLPSISLQSWQIPPGTSHLGDMRPCVQNSWQSGGQALWCQGCARDGDVPGRLLGMPLWQTA